jgi:hypothetical protein
MVLRLSRRSLNKKTGALQGSVGTFPEENGERRNGRQEAKGVSHPSRWRHRRRVAARSQRAADGSADWVFGKWCG